MQYIPILLFFISFSVSAQNTKISYRVEKVADDFQFVEGPVWKDGRLLFSDIPANTIYSWHPNSGTSVYLSPSGNSNGLALDSEGRLLLAQHGKRSISLIQNDRTEIQLAGSYRGKKLNSPNDLAVKSDGSIFFTDPPYGINATEEELGFYGIYRVNSDGHLRLLDASLKRPNGIAFSPDESKLYVNDSEVRKIYVWDVVNDSMIVNKQLFASMNVDGYADGMKTDPTGYLFSAGPIGIWVFSPDGEVLDTIPIPGQTTNCGWGAEGSNTLFVTSGTAVFKVTVIMTDIGDKRQGYNKSPSFELFNNYPNPFNGKTFLHFDLFQSGNVNISILNNNGEKVDMVINRFLNSGTYQIPWAAGNFSSGMYFAHMQTSAGTADTKCLLIK